MQKTKIDWPGLDYTWNPVTGCFRGCEYCVVRNRVWPRIKHLYGDHNYDTIIFHPDKISIPESIKKPSTFFVGFYSDIQYWTTEWIESIIDKCKRCPQHTFMFLSKGFGSYDWFVLPPNCITGITIAGIEGDITNVNTAFCSDEINNFISYNNRCFLSIEPLLGYIPKINEHKNLERVIVGAMTGSNAIVPQKKWIQSVRDNVPEEKIYWKNNIKKYLYV